MADLKKELTLFSLTMVAVGSCIGSGIFITPAEIAQYLGNSHQILLVWLIGGVISLTGALTFAELGGLFQDAGGVFIYLKAAYGRLVAFLYGWVILTVVTSGALAALSVAFARFLQFVWPFQDAFRPWIAVIVLALLTVVNILGVKMGEWVSNIFTSLKLIGMLVIVAIALAMGTEHPFAGTSVPAAFEPFSFTAFGGALIGVLWSYGGWYHASFLAGEAKNPQRNVPRAMVFGALIVTAMYVLTNLAYLYLLPVSRMAGSAAIAADAVESVLKIGGFLVALIIVLSIFGTISIYTLSAPRVYFAMAKSKVFFPGLAYIHPKYRTPVRAILLQSSWAIVLVLFWQTFENLIAYVVFMDWIFMILGALSIFIFRRTMPDTPRPYRTTWFPVTPLVFIGISTWFVGNMLFEKPIQALFGGALLLLGLPLFVWFTRHANAG